jgi:hypothetical protein
MGHGTLAGHKATSGHEASTGHENGHEKHTKRPCRGTGEGKEDKIIISRPTLSKRQTSGDVQISTCAS